MAGSRRLMATLAAAAIIVAGCGGGGGGSGGGPDPTTPPTDPPTTDQPDDPSDDGSGDETDTTEPGADEVEYDIAGLLAQDPLVIFNAYPPRPDHIDYPLPPGQRDFFDLWEPGAPWQTALEHVDVYRLHAFQMRHFLTDDQIVTLVEFLREHEIPLMLETEPLLPPTDCAHSESFEGPWDLEMAERLHRLGGRIDIIAIEQPYHYAHKLDGPDSCQYPLDRIIDEVQLHVDGLRDLFGDIPVGTIEGVWPSPATTPQDMEIWLDTWEESTGEPFAFLHLDPNWYWQDWADVAAGIEAVADARGVPFGVLYNGGSELDGLTWMNFMMANAAELEVGHGVTPQHVSIQSWVALPDHALPDDDLTALTSGIVRYFGERLELFSEATPDGIVVSARGLDGSPLEGVTVRATRDGGGPSVATQTVRATVPAGVTEALILVRANVEDATPGDAAAVLHEVSVTHGADGPNLVPNGDFAAGATDWGVYGSHPDGVTAVAAGSGRGLSIRAAPDQDILIDGPTFPVTPGADFELSVTYEAAGTPDSVVVTVAFIGVSRTNVFLHALPTELGEFVTGPDGTVLIPRDLIGAGPATVDIVSDGDLERWPGRTSVTID